MRQLCGVVFVVLSLMLAQLGPARAGLINGSLSLDTSALSGTFELAFVLIDGSGTGNANNTASLARFRFGGGGAGAVDTLLTTPGALGNLATGVTLTDSEFFNVFAETFTAGKLLTFDFGLTTNPEPSGTPDQFALALLQSDGTPISSSDPSGALLLVNIDSAQPAFGRFATAFTPEPIVTFAAAAVPEPPPILLVAIALIAVLSSARNRAAIWGTSRLPFAVSGERVR